jgi:hypothetical protein
MVFECPNEAFPETARHVLTGLFDHCRATAASIETVEAEIVIQARQDETARRSLSGILCEGLLNLTVRRSAHRR